MDSQTPERPITIKTTVLVCPNPTTEMPGQSPKNCKKQTLKYLNSRPALIAICTLVVIECVCVLAELMVDLQGIKFRFQNEENEFQRFIEHLKKTYPEEFQSFKGRTFEELLNKLQHSTRLKGEKDLLCDLRKCGCYANKSTAQGDASPEDKNTQESSEPYKKSDTQTVSTVTTSGAGSDNSVVELHDVTSENDTNTTQTNGLFYIDVDKLFVLEVNNAKESFFLVAEYYPAHVEQNYTKHEYYRTEYDKIHQASQGIHLGSLAILSIMVIETFIKLFCMGPRFFRKKFEVFDAFIVIASFALDFVFLDSRWYETGKDASTILVLLLPWRVVRIVNSFLMTVNHKHHIEMMTVKRSKKKADNKITKLQNLLAEIRQDVQLLIALCRSRDIPENEISACVYGKGRRNPTEAAMSLFASLMLISTLGKNAIYEDEIYGRLFQEALQDDDEEEDGTENDVKEDTDIDEAICVEMGTPKKKDTKKRKNKKGKWVRSYTVPRRSNSLEPCENGNVFYVNDAYTQAIAKDDSRTEARRPSYQSKASVRSTPSYSRGRNYVTFEVTTHVTYL